MYSLDLAPVTFYVSILFKKINKQSNPCPNRSQSYWLHRYVLQLCLKLYICLFFLGNIQTVEGIHGKSNWRCCQHRHWRIWFGASDGNRSVKTLRKRAPCPLCLEHRWYPYGRNTQETSSRDNSLHHSQQNLHHSGDHHQRQLSQKLVPPVGQECK